MAREAHTRSRPLRCLGKTLRWRWRAITSSPPRHPRRSLAYGVVGVEQCQEVPVRLTRMPRWGKQDLAMVRKMEAVQCTMAPMAMELHTAASSDQSSPTRTFRAYDCDKVRVEEFQAVWPTSIQSLMLTSISSPCRDPRSHPRRSDTSCYRGPQHPLPYGSQC